AQSDPELKAAYLQRDSSPRRALAVAAVERAKERGQLRADLDAETVVATSSPSSWTARSR
ncbi:MAG: hypothetical protein QOD59_1745, partial [Mycobacterium sp.]|nr:hypothetical protein [Mycobacterium sp.]